MKILRKVTIALLIFGIAISPISLSNVFAESSDTLTKEFYDASDDTIVAWYEGEPIYKSDVDIETQLLTEEANARLDKIDKAILENRASDIRRIKAGYSSAILEKTLTAPQFSQKTISMYYKSSTADKFAREVLLGNPERDFGKFLFSLAPQGAIVSVVDFIVTLRDKQLAKDIWAHVDRKEHVCVKLIKTKYGKLYKVSKWDGVYLDYSLYSSNVAKEKLTKVTFLK